MEQKEEIKVSEVFLFIAIVAIIVLGYFLYTFYTEKEDSKNKVETLNEEILALKNSIYNLQDEINKINTDDKKDNYDENDDKDNEDNTIEIEGTYNIVDSEETENISYTFSEGIVVYEALDRAEGTYEIINNMVKITYTKASDPEGKELDTFPNGETEELTIVDENTLVNSKEINGITYSGKYVKE